MTKAAGSARRATDDHHTCDGALIRAFAFLGKRWNGLILSTLMHGATGFADLKRGVGGISDSVLSDRLNELSRAGLVVRTVESGPPVSVTYSLAESGRALAPALLALRDWAEENLPADAGTGNPPP